jgi:glycine cleavage system regulatory protein
VPAYIIRATRKFQEKQVADKEDMIDGFEELFSTAKMEIMTNRTDVAGNRQLFGQVQGFFIAMRMTVPLDMEEIEYVEDRLRSLEERIG